MQNTLVFLGITFQFLAFWLVAPQFIGQDALKKMEVIFDKVIGKTHSLITLLAGIFFGMALTYSFLSQEFELTILFISKVIILSIFLLLYLIFNKKIEKYLIKVISKPIQNKLQNKEVVKKVFYFGAFLFILGYFFQVLSLVV